MTREVPLSIKKLASAMGLQNPREVFHLHRKRLLRRVGKEFSELFVKHPIPVFTQLAEMFDFELRQFLDAYFNHLIPYVVVACSKHSDETALENFVRATSSGCERHQLLRKHSKQVIAYIVTSTTFTTEEIDKAFRFLKQQSRQSWETLTRPGDLSLLVELMLNFSYNPDGVMAALNMVYSTSDQVRKFEKSEIAVRMAPQVLGIISNLHRMLHNSLIPFTEKSSIITALDALIDLIGKKHVAPIRHKLVAVLKRVLIIEVGLFPMLCLKLWKTFIKNLHVSLLASLTAEITASLVPYLYFKPVEAASLIHTMVVSNAKELQQQVGWVDLEFLPQDIPELDRVWEQLRIWREKSAIHDHLVSVLKRFPASLPKENSTLALYGLSKLKSTLLKFQKELTSLIMEGGFTHEMFTRVLETLGGMTGSDVDTDVLFSVGQCLGVLGAIDPSRLNTTMASSTYSFTFYPNITEPKMIQDLLNSVCQLYCSAETTELQNQCEYAIQQMLRAFNLGPGKTSGEYAFIWSSLPPEMETVLRPLCSSKYAYNSEVFTPPIYRPDLSVMDFQGHWYSFLVSIAQDEGAKKVLSAYLPLSVKGLQPVLPLIPYALAYAVLGGTDENRAQIIQEIKSVIRDAAQDDWTSSKTNNSHAIMEALFPSLDHLRKLVCHLQEQVTEAELQTNKNARKQNPITSPEIQLLEGFLKQLPERQLAVAAFKCGLYRRCLFHWENHLQKQPDDLSASFEEIQSAYLHLNDEDGVLGIAGKRKEVRSLKEWAIESEINGDLQTAYATYDIVLRSSKLTAKERAKLFKGRFRCHLQLGPLSQVMLEAEKASQKWPDLSNQMQEYYVEAAWRLAQWDDLDKALKEFNSDATPRLSNGGMPWSKHVGHLFSFARQGHWEEFQRQKKEAVLQETKRMLSVSLEPGSYGMLYGRFLNLHMLSDIEYGVEKFLGSESTLVLSNENEVEKIFEAWEAREKILQPNMSTLESVLNIRRTLLLLGIHALGSGEITLAEKSGSPVRKRLIQRLGESWLQGAKMARKSSHFIRACTHIQEASTILGDCPAVTVELAKYHWNKADQNMAIQTLDRGLQRFFSHIPITKNRLDEALNGNLSAEGTPLDGDKIQAAKMKFLLTKYCETAGFWDSKTVIDRFNEVILLHNKWEKAYFHLASATERYVEENPAEQNRFLPLCVEDYFRALRHGNSFVYQALPKLLTLFLDFGSKIHAEENTATESDKKALTRLTKSVQTGCEILPHYKVFTAFPQLVSRICHSQPEVFSCLKDIISRLLAAMPERTIWSIIAVQQSSYPIRKLRCEQITRAATKLSPGFQKFLTDVLEFANALIGLANKPLPNSRKTTLSLSRDYPTLLNLLKDPTFTRILIPFQRQMSLTLPRCNPREKDFDPFDNVKVYISGFEDTVNTMHSLVRPKKLTLRGSDGKQYSLLAKPKDDLRKDCRLMEFNSLVNRCLARDPAARRRGLHINTYSVVPLNEEVGFVEWVPNLTPMRGIICKFYKEMGIYMNQALNFKPFKEIDKKPQAERKEIYHQQLLPAHPSVLYKWFPRNFPDAKACYEARLSYARTAAVMSMIGYIVGLGDRHGENILFNSSNGEVLHVDFSCLFNKSRTQFPPSAEANPVSSLSRIEPSFLPQQSRTQFPPSAESNPVSSFSRGEPSFLPQQSRTQPFLVFFIDVVAQNGETLTVPEKVPFRLTRQMVEAMGCTGFEGPFRQACEATLKVVRDQKGSFMSVLKPFIHDPLVEWTKTTDSRKGTGEIVNEKGKYNEKPVLLKPCRVQAVAHVSEIERRIEGRVRRFRASANKSGPLSIQGQVNWLISEATDEDNLADMFIGWAAFLFHSVERAKDGRMGWISYVTYYNSRAVGVIVTCILRRFMKPGTEINIDLTRGPTRLRMLLNGLELHVYNRSQLYSSLETLFGLEEILIPPDTPAGTLWNMLRRGKNNSRTSRSGSTGTASSPGAEAKGTTKDSWWIRWRDFFPVVKVELSSSRAVFGNRLLPTTLSLSVEEARCVYSSKTSQNPLDYFMHTITGEVEGFKVMLSPSPKYTGPVDIPPRFMGEGFVTMATNKGNFYYYWDEPGVVPAPNDKIFEDVLDQAVLEVPPVWGMQLKCSKKLDVSYGPWADRQRDALFRFFYPSSYETQVPSSPLPPGSQRSCVAFDLRLSLIDRNDGGQIDLLFTIEELARSNPLFYPRNPWILVLNLMICLFFVLAVSSLTVICEERFPEHCRFIMAFGAIFVLVHLLLAIATAIRMAAFIPRTKEEETQALHLQMGPGSYLDAYIPLTIGPEGYRNKITGTIMHVEATTSLLYRHLLECETLEFTVTYDHPLHWNGHQECNVALTACKASADLIMAHKLFVQDLLQDWSSTDRSDVLSFVPYTYKISLSLQQCEVVLPANQYNWIDCGSQQAENECSSRSACGGGGMASEQSRRRGVTIRNRTEAGVSGKCEPSRDTYVNALDILERFRCTSCKEITPPPIPQCKMGHLICVDCRNNLNSCPKCQCPISAQRNIAMEAVSEVIPFPCKYNKFGCGEYYLLRDKNRHEEVCKCQPFTCPFCERKIPGNSVALLEHIRQSHPDKTILESTLESPINIPQLRELRRQQEPFTESVMLRSQDKLFVFSTYYDPPRCLWSFMIHIFEGMHISMNPAAENSYKYRLEFSRETKKLVYDGVAIPWSIPIETVAQQNKCLSLNDDFFINGFYGGTVKVQMIKR
ncbi:unnamed protein product [Cyprideis torosa]|uniref:Serine/threonine-protein kinase ATR n=1 Tax=Cyprideis torosa TaxID=163714 RepID=A0A7R8ZPR0_9CRUS|nr:unnamed protein product [Cyprideis torosa]CAG0890403.1 unnamed protein product [Cyprideis torosa]